MKKTFLGMLVLGVVTTFLWAAEPTKKADRETLEKAFSERMSDVKMVGLFSIDGKDSSKNSPDKYQIVSARKIRDDDWVVTAKMKIGKDDVDLPIPIKIYWADDTPVMSLTDLTIPGMGTFTARVMFYGDRYAGTWQHGQVGGHMWGLLEKPAAKE